MILFKKILAITGIVLLALTGISGITVGVMFLAGAFDEQVVELNNISFEDDEYFVSGSNVSDTFTIVVKPDVENTTQKELTLSFVNVQVPTVSDDGKSISDGIIIMPRTARVGESITISYARENIVNEFGEVFPWIKGGISEIRATSVNQTVSPTITKVHVDVPVHSVEIKFYTESNGSQTEVHVGANGNPEIVSGADFIAKAVFFPEKSEKMFSSETEKKTAFFETLPDDESYVERFDENVFKAIDDRLNVTIRAKVFKNATTEKRLRAEISSVGDEFYSAMLMAMNATNSVQSKPEKSFVNFKGYNVGKFDADDNYTLTLNSEGKIAESMESPLTSKFSVTANKPLILFANNTNIEGSYNQSLGMSIFSDQGNINLQSRLINLGIRFHRLGAGNVLLPVNSEEIRVIDQSNNNGHVAGTETIDGEEYYCIRVARIDPNKSFFEILTSVEGTFIAEIILIEKDDAGNKYAFEDVNYVALVSEINPDLGVSWEGINLEAFPLVIVSGAETIYARHDFTANAGVPASNLYTNVKFFAHFPVETGITTNEEAGKIISYERVETYNLGADYKLYELESGDVTFYGEVTGIQILFMTVLTNYYGQPIMNGTKYIPIEFSKLHSSISFVNVNVSKTMENLAGSIVVDGDDYIPAKNPDGSEIIDFFAFVEGTEDAFTLEIECTDESDKFIELWNGGQISIIARDMTSNALIDIAELMQCRVRKEAGGYNEGAAIDSGNIFSDTAGSETREYIVIDVTLKRPAYQTGEDNRSFELLLKYRKTADIISEIRVNAVLKTSDSETDWGRFIEIYNGEAKEIGFAFFESETNGVDKNGALGGTQNNPIVISQSFSGGVESVERTIKKANDENLDEAHTVSESDITETIVLDKYRRVVEGQMSTPVASNSKFIEIVPDGAGGYTLSFKENSMDTPVSYYVRIGSVDNSANPLYFKVESGFISVIEKDTKEFRDNGLTPPEEDYKIVFAHTSTGETADSNHAISDATEVIVVNKAGARGSNIVLSQLVKMWYGNDAGAIGSRGAEMTNALIYTLNLSTFERITITEYNSLKTMIKIDNKSWPEWNPYRKDFVDSIKLLNEGGINSIEILRDFAQEFALLFNVRTEAGLVSRAVQLNITYNIYWNDAINSHDSNLSESESTKVYKGVYSGAVVGFTYNAASQRGIDIQRRYTVSSSIVDSGLRTAEGIGLGITPMGVLRLTNPSDAILSGPEYGVLGGIIFNDVNNISGVKMDLNINDGNPNDNLYALNIPLFFKVHPNFVVDYKQEGPDKDTRRVSTRGSIIGLLNSYISVQRVYPSREDVYGYSFSTSTSGFDVYGTASSSDNTQGLRTTGTTPINGKQAVVIGVAYAGAVKYITIYIVPDIRSNVEEINGLVKTPDLARMHFINYEGEEHLMVQAAVNNIYKMNDNNTGSDPDIRKAFTIEDGPAGGNQTTTRIVVSFTPSTGIITPQPSSGFVYFGGSETYRPVTGKTVNVQLWIKEADGTWDLNGVHVGSIDFPLYISTLSVPAIQYEECGCEDCDCADGEVGEGCGCELDTEEAKNKRGNRIANKNVDVLFGSMQDLVDNNVYDSFNAGSTYYVVKPVGISVEGSTGTFGIYAYGPEVSYKIFDANGNEGSKYAVKEGSGDTTRVRLVSTSSSDVYIFIEVSYRSTKVYYRIKIIPDAKLVVNNPYVDESETTGQTQEYFDFNDSIELNVKSKNYIQPGTNGKKNIVINMEEKYANEDGIEDSAVTENSASYTPNGISSYQEPGEERVYYYNRRIMAMNLVTGKPNVGALYEYSIARLVVDSVEKPLATIGDYLSISEKTGNGVLTIFETASELEITVRKTYPAYNDFKDYKINVNGRPYIGVGAEQYSIQYKETVDGVTGNNANSMQLKKIELNVGSTTAQDIVGYEKYKDYVKNISLKIYATDQVESDRTLQQLRVAFSESDKVWMIDKDGERTESIVDAVNLEVASNLPKNGSVWMILYVMRENSSYDSYGEYARVEIGLQSTIRIVNATSLREQRGHTMDSPGEFDFRDKTDGIEIVQWDPAVIGKDAGMLAINATYARIDHSVLNVWEYKEESRKTGTAPIVIDPDTLEETGGEDIFEDIWDWDKSSYSFETGDYTKLDLMASTGVAIRNVKVELGASAVTNLNKEIDYAIANDSDNAGLKALLNGKKFEFAEGMTFAIIAPTAEIYKGVTDLPVENFELRGIMFMSSSSGATAGINFKVNDGSPVLKQVSLDGKVAIYEFAITTSQAVNKFSVKDIDGYEFVSYPSGGKVLKYKYVDIKIAREDGVSISADPNYIVRVEKARGLYGEAFTEVAFKILPVKAVKVLLIVATVEIDYRDLEGGGSIEKFEFEYTLTINPFITTLAETRARAIEEEKLLVAGDTNAGSIFVDLGALFKLENSDALNVIKTYETFTVSITDLTTTSNNLEVIDITDLDTNEYASYDPDTGHITFKTNKSFEAATITAKVTVSYKNANNYTISIESYYRFTILPSITLQINYPAPEDNMLEYEALRFDQYGEGNDFDFYESALFAEDYLVLNITFGDIIGNREIWLTIEDDDEEEVEYCLSDIYESYSRSVKKFVIALKKLGVTSVKSVAISNLDETGGIESENIQANWYVTNSRVNVSPVEYLRPTEGTGSDTDRIREVENVETSILNYDIRVSPMSSPRIWIHLGNDVKLRISNGAVYLVNALGEHSGQYIDYNDEYATADFSHVWFEKVPSEVLHAEEIIIFSIYAGELLIGEYKIILRQGDVITMYANMINSEQGEELFFQEQMMKGSEGKIFGGYQLLSYFYRNDAIFGSIGTSRNIYFAVPTDKKESEIVKESTTQGLFNGDTFVYQRGSAFEEWKVIYIDSITSSHNNTSHLKEIDILLDNLKPRAFYFADSNLSTVFSSANAYINDSNISLKTRVQFRYDGMDVEWAKIRDKISYKEASTLNIKINFNFESTFVTGQNIEFNITAVNKFTGDRVKSNDITIAGATGVTTKSVLLELGTSFAGTITDWGNYTINQITYISGAEHVKGSPAFVSRDFGTSVTEGLIVDYSSETAIVGNSYEVNFFYRDGEKDLPYKEISSVYVYRPELDFEVALATTPGVEHAVEAKAGVPISLINSFQLKHRNGTLLKSTDLYDMNKRNVEVPIAGFSSTSASFTLKAVHKENPTMVNSTTITINKSENENEDDDKDTLFRKKIDLRNYFSITNFDSYVIETVENKSGFVAGVDGDVKVREISTAKLGLRLVTTDTNYKTKETENLPYDGFEAPNFVRFSPVLTSATNENSTVIDHNILTMGAPGNPDLDIHDERQGTKVKMEVTYEVGANKITRYIIVFAKPDWQVDTNGGGSNPNSKENPHVIEFTPAVGTAASTYVAPIANNATPAGTLIKAVRTGHAPNIDSATSFYYSFRECGSGGMTADSLNPQEFIQTYLEGNFPDGDGGSLNNNLSSFGWQASATQKYLGGLNFIRKPGSNTSVNVKFMAPKFGTKDIVMTVMDEYGFSFNYYFRLIPDGQSPAYQRWEGGSDLYEKAEFDVGSDFWAESETTSGSKVFRTPSTRTVKKIAVISGLRADLSGISVTESPTVDSVLVEELKLIINGEIIDNGISWVGSPGNRVSTFTPYKRAVIELLPGKYWAQGAISQSATIRIKLSYDRDAGGPLDSEITYIYAPITLKKKYTMLDSPTKVVQDGEEFELDDYLDTNDVESGMGLGVAQIRNDGIFVNPRNFNTGTNSIADFANGEKVTLYAARQGSDVMYTSPVAADVKQEGATKAYIPQLRNVFPSQINWEDGISDNYYTKFNIFSEKDGLYLWNTSTPGATVPTITMVYKVTGKPGEDFMTLAGTRTLDSSGKLFIPITDMYTGSGSSRYYIRNQVGLDYIKMGSIGSGVDAALVLSGNDAFATVTTTKLYYSAYIHDRTVSTTTKKVEATPGTYESISIKLKYGDYSGLSVTPSPVLISLDSNGKKEISLWKYFEGAAEQANRNHIVLAEEPIGLEDIRTIKAYKLYDDNIQITVPARSDAVTLRYSLRKLTRKVDSTTGVPILDDEDEEIWEWNEETDIDYTGSVRIDETYAVDKYLGISNIIGEDASISVDEKYEFRITQMTPRPTGPSFWTYAGAEYQKIRVMYGNGGDWGLGEVAPVIYYDSSAWVTDSTNWNSKKLEVGKLINKSKEIIHVPDSGLLNNATGKIGGVVKYYIVEIDGVRYTRTVNFRVSSSVYQVATPSNSVTVRVGEGETGNKVTGTGGIYVVPLACWAKNSYLKIATRNSNGTYSAVDFLDGNPTTPQVWNLSDYYEVEDATVKVNRKKLEFVIDTSGGGSGAAIISNGTITTGASFDADEQYIDIKVFAVVSGVYGTYKTDGQNNGRVEIGLVRLIINKTPIAP